MYNEAAISNSLISPKNKTKSNLCALANDNAAAPKALNFSFSLFNKNFLNHGFCFEG